MGGNVFEIVGLGRDLPWSLPTEVVERLDLLLAGMAGIGSGNAGCWGEADRAPPSKGSNDSAVIAASAEARGCQPREQDYCLVVAVQQFRRRCLGKSQPEFLLEAESHADRPESL